MNRQNYRAAFDAVDFSPDFEERTLQKLAAMRHASEKEQNKMSMNRTKKITLLAAAAVALLAVTVSAAVLWLTPAQVAVELNDPMLAEAFQSEAAVILNETQTVGDYTVTLMGMVSGANISQWCADVQESRTYAVVSVVRTDGTPLTEENYDVVPCGAFTVTPLVSGYDPRAVNVFTLNGACSSFLRDAGPIMYWTRRTWRYFRITRYISRCMRDSPPPPMSVSPWQKTAQWICGTM